MEEAIDLLGDDIAVIHLKDFIVEKETIVAVAAGRGDLDYKPVLEFIKKKKPMVHCTLENTTPDNAAIAKEFISSLWEKA